MLDPSWTPKAGYSHADKIMEILRRKERLFMSEFWKVYFDDGTHTTYEFVYPVSESVAQREIEKVEKDKKVIHLKEG